MFVPISQQFKGFVTRECTKTKVFTGGGAKDAEAELECISSAY
jgi:hypothetical protein